MDPRLVSYEDYVAMCGCPPVMGITAMLATYKLSMHDWTQIATYWNGLIATSPQYAQHGLRVEQEAARIRGGGAPRPVSFAAAFGGSAPLGPPLGVPPPGVGAVPPGATPAEGAPHLAAAPAGGPPAPVAMHAVSGAMPGAVPPPAFAAPAPGYGAASPSPAAWTAAAPAPGYPGAAPAPGYPGAAPAPVYPGAAPAPGYPAPAYPAPAPGYAQPSGYNSHAAQLGNEVGNAFSAFGSALDSFVSSAVGTFAVHAPVLVQWSDGQRYPATVLATNAGQVQVVFPDGRQVWVPSQYVVSR